MRKLFYFWNILVCLILLTPCQSSYAAGPRVNNAAALNAHVHSAAAPRGNGAAARNFPRGPARYRNEKSYASNGGPQRYSANSAEYQEERRGLRENRGEGVPGGDWQGDYRQGEGQDYHEQYPQDLNAPSFSYGGFYRKMREYYEGMYENDAGIDYVVVPPPLGSTISVLPADYETIRRHGVTYYTDDQTFYVQTPDGYEVVLPPR